MGISRLTSPVGAITSDSHFHLLLVLNSNGKNKMPENELVNGRIIRLSPRGYGFIISQEIPFTRFFFHWTELHQNTKKFTELEEGMQVTFVPMNVGERGWRALRVRVIENGNVENGKSQTESNT